MLQCKTFGKLFLIEHLFQKFISVDFHVFLVYLYWWSNNRGYLYEASFRAKWTTYNSVYSQSYTTVYMKYSEMKLIAGDISLRSFWQKLNFISGDKCYANTAPKWNHPKVNICACEYFIKTKTLDQKIKTKMDFILPAMKANINRIFFMAK